MTKIVQAKSSFSRKYGVNLWGLSGDAFEKKPYIPGQHGSKVNRSRGGYRGQLVAKQKLKFYYCISERKIKNIARAGVKSMENSVEYLVSRLETMLIAVVFRASFASTMFFAKQLISHGHILVNGKKLNIFTCNLKEGDVVSLTEKAKKIPTVLQFFQSSTRTVPDYLELNKSEMTIKLKRMPKSSEVPFEAQMEPGTVIEFYSK